MARRASGPISAADTVAERFAAAFGRIAPEGPLGVALSGGGDSTALTVLAAERAGQRVVRAATVDHQLRPESRGEAEAAAALCASLQIPHDILTWDEGRDAAQAAGNLSARARAARQGLLGAWAAHHGLAGVLLGHTLDDQAETLVMRLQRGSGVDGLAAMAETVEIGGTLWLRPLLSLRRAELRDLLTRRGIGWSDDPTNDDPAYDRIRARQTIAALKLDAEALAATAHRLGQQRRVLEAARDRLAAQAVALGPCGELRLQRRAFEAAEEDTRLTVFADAITWIGGLAYPPRFDALVRAWGAETQATLGQCLIRHDPEQIMISREPDRVAAPVATPARWDRWQSETPDLTLGALGARGLGILKSSSQNPSPRILPTGVPPT